MRVLLVEDDCVDAENVGRMLRWAKAERGVEVIRSRSLMAALEELRSGRSFDLVLLDLGLPDSRGLEAARRIREAAPDLPVVVLTGRHDQSLAVEAVRQGAQDYLVKGEVQGDTLVRAMRYAVERKKTELAPVGATRKLERRTADLERRNAELQQFVYTVSHDLKSPLVTMRGFLGILKSGYSAGQDNVVKDSIRRIEKATSHMSRLIEDLLELSQAGRVRDEIETLDVHALLDEVTTVLRPYLDQMGATLQIDDDLPSIEADRAAVMRVFENLFNNALKYGCPGPDAKIAVGAETIDGEVRFFVKDNGPGIAPEYHEKIFRLFQRLHNDPSGTGVGLAIVEKIMAAHNGRVWVESTPGKGATFWLAFKDQREALPDAL